ncbi:MAG: DUF2292 domain-containing protein [Clostridiaceae bacterium]
MVTQYKLTLTKLTWKETIFVDADSISKDRIVVKKEIDLIIYLIGKLKFGSINITVRNGKIEKIEKEEKFKLK